MTVIYSPDSCLRGFYQLLCWAAARAADRRQLPAVAKICSKTTFRQESAASHFGVRKRQQFSE
ncbi:MAG: hypothetical protein CVV42_14230 [Candidatus Riflebacteria bacterium HGW-Riflebacteria-2]|nr:MAG: hypothetical protein CVV42_14230 [Candidatus Riflebacteria bacterium HGW-Riflebacteria-2]